MDFWYFDAITVQLNCEYDSDILKIYFSHTAFYNAFIFFKYPKSKNDVIMHISDWDPSPQNIYNKNKANNPQNSLAKIGTDL